MTLAETARRCLAGVAESTSPMESSNGGTEITRYEIVKEQSKKEEGKVKTH